MSVRLDDSQRAVLAGFRALDPKLENQYNAWYPPLVGAVKSASVDLEMPYPPPLEREVQSLVRRGLLGAEGRGKWRQFWLTQAGLDALAAVEKA